MIILACPGQVVVLPSAIATARRAQLPPSCQFVSPLAEPAERDVIDLVAIVDPRTPWPKQMRHTEHPTVCLIGDDPGGPDGLGGPDAWRCACKLQGWAEAAIVHACGGEARHYVAGFQATLLMRRVVFIETTSLHAAAWVERIGCPRTLVFLPNDGPHPVLHRGTVH